MDMPPQKISRLLLRGGLAFAFLYPPIDALLDPITWIGYFPKFMHGIVPDMVLLHSFGAFKVAIAVWIIFGRKIRIPSILAAAVLVAIVLLNLQDFQIVFRDLSIAAIALALAIDG